MVNQVEYRFISCQSHPLSTRIKAKKAFNDLNDGRKYNKNHSTIAEVV